MEKVSTAGVCLLELKEFFYVFLAVPKCRKHISCVQTKHLKCVFLVWDADFLCLKINFD